METDVKNAVLEHGDYQRLQKVFSLDFVVDCISNPRRGDAAKMIGNLLRQNASNPTLFINSVHYHELVELEGFRKMGYPDEQLGANHSQDPNYNLADTQAKRKEFEFYQYVANKVMGKGLPFLSLPFAQLAATKDFGSPLRLLM